MTLLKPIQVLPATERAVVMMAAHHEAPNGNYTTHFTVDDLSTGQVVVEVVYRVVHMWALCLRSELIGDVMEEVERVVAPVVMGRQGMEIIDPSGTTVIGWDGAGAMEAYAADAGLFEDRMIEDYYRRIGAHFPPPGYKSRGPVTF